VIANEPPQMDVCECFLTRELPMLSSLLSCGPSASVTGNQYGISNRAYAQHTFQCSVEPPPPFNIRTRRSA
jgi:hypothetical protein